MKFVFGVVAALFVVALIIFPEVRKKLKVLVSGFLNIWVEDAAKTPDGANAVFNQAIEEAQRRYNQAASTLNKLSGELSHAEMEVKKLTKDIADTEKTCERLVQSGNMAEAEIYAARRSELMSELNQKKDCADKLRPMVAEAKQIHESYEKKLRDLRRAQKETVNKLKMNAQMKDLLGDLDDLKRDTATDKLLGAVRDGASDLQKEVDGARIVHENRTTTKVARAEQKAAQVQNDAYLESLKKKYGGK